MNIWSKVLVGIIIFLTPLLLYLTARSFKEQEQYRLQVNQLERDIERLTALNEELRGTRPDEGIRAREVQLNAVTLGRGRVWSDCQPDPVVVNAENGQVQTAVTVGSPQPHQIVSETVLYVFKMPVENQPAAYLGQFRVTEVAEQKVGLTPALKLSESELTRLQAAAGPWMMYDTLPVDTHQAFAGATDEVKSQLLPAATAAEYVKDGKPSEGTDPAERVVDGKFSRALRDYAQLFVEYQRQRTLRTDAIAAARLDLQYAQRSLEDAQRQVEFHRNEIAGLKAEVALYTHERDAVTEYREKLTAALQESRDSVAKTLASNQQLAAQIAAAQLEALRRADALEAAEGEVAPAN